jgi:hypothetical protein
LAAWVQRALPAKKEAEMVVDAVVTALDAHVVKLWVNLDDFARPLVYSFAHVRQRDGARIPTIRKARRRIK